MYLSDISVRNPVFAWMLMLGIMVFGWIGFSRLGISQFPDVDYPTITIQVSREGASAESMETEVVDVIEDAIMSVEGVTEITSSSRQGRATITVEFDLNKDIDIALQDVQAKIAQAQRMLPYDIDPPIISKANPEDQPIIWVALTGHRSPRELIDYAKYKLKPYFQTIPGVADIMMVGLDRNIRVWVDIKKLEAYQLTIGEVIDAIRKQHIDVPSGRIENDVKEFNLRFTGEAPSVQEIGNIVIKETDDYHVLLKDVAKVEDGLEDKRRITRSNGIPAQGMGIKKARGANAVAVARAIRAKIEEIKKFLPPDLNLAIRFDATIFIEESIAEIEFALILSIIFTALICWLFLGSLSSTLNVVLAIPTALCGTFAVMYFSNFTLNMITLLALSLSVGIIVDDAIMVLENIYRHAESGLSRKEAALIGARQITFAALSATLAIVAIFLPVAFMKGLAGKFFFQFGVTISVAVLFSYLEAVTLTPARCSQILEVGHRFFIVKFVDKGINILKQTYSAILPFCLAYRYFIVVAGVVIFVSSLYFVKLLGKELVPSQDQGRFLVRLQTPPGSSINVMDTLIRHCEEFLMKRPEVGAYYAAVGGFGGGEVDSAVMFITMVPAKQRSITQEQFIQIVRKEFNSIPGLRATVLDISRQDPGGRRSFPIDITIKGPDWEVLGKSANDIMEKMRLSGIFVDVDSNYRVGMPELRIIPDRKRAADAGVSMETIGNTIRATLGGLRVARFEEKGKRYDIRVRLLKPERLRKENIEDLFVKSYNGELVKLTDLVEIRQMPVLQLITRHNRERAITITANMAPNIPQHIALEEALKIARNNLPEGYTAELSGGAQTFKETFANLLFALILGVVVAYMILASQFNSYIHPFTILIALPFSITGALISLWLSNHTLNFFSMIGILLLMGIVKKNSIILVDFINQLREEGKPLREAILQACPIRLRPILMTTASTIAGAIPPALALGPGGELRVPMAIAVIGGLSLSALMTLILVPSIYHIFEDIKKLFRR